MPARCHLTVFKSINLIFYHKYKLVLDYSTHFDRVIGWEHEFYDRSRWRFYCSLWILNELQAQAQVDRSQVFIQLAQFSAKKSYIFHHFKTSFKLVSLENASEVHSNPCNEIVTKFSICSNICVLSIFTSGSVKSAFISSSVTRKYLIDW